MSADEAERLYRPVELPRSASGGVSQWVLDETLGHDPERVVPRRRSTRRPIRATLGVALMVVLGVGAWASMTDRLPPSPGGAVAGEGIREFPTPAFEAAVRPIGVPPSAAASGGYRFMAMQDDGSSPVAYDPCRPIHYVIRESGAPPNGTQLIASAVASVSTATGLQFVYDGTTTETPAPQRTPYQPDRYGDRWAPVLFSWVTPEESPDVAGNVAGIAGSVHLSVADSPRVYVTGTVELDAPQLSEHLSQRRRRAARAGGHPARAGPPGRARPRRRCRPAHVPGDQGGRHRLRCRRPRRSGCARQRSVCTATVTRRRVALLRAVSKEPEMDVAAKVTSKGQVTVPKVVRDALGIKEGDEVVFRVDGRRAVMAKTPAFLTLAGTIKVPAKKRNAAWDDVIRKARTARVARHR